VAEGGSRLWFTMYQRRIKAFMLDADYYRAQADLCLKLAHAALAAKPLRDRLVLLADDYKDKAKSARSSPAKTDGSNPNDHDTIWRFGEFS
jgi:hypothetical protein